MTISKANAVSLEREINWFSAVLGVRFSLYFSDECEFDSIDDMPPPDLEDDVSEYARLVHECGLNTDERLVLILALTPHLQPQILDVFFTQNTDFDRGFTEFGGWRGNTHGGFLPTCETAAFILAGPDLHKRFEVAQMFEEAHVFSQKDIIRLEPQAHGEPFFSSRLVITTEYLHRLTSGISYKPDYSLTFPAKRITTDLDWEDLVLAPDVLDEIENIDTWLRHARVIMDEWGLGKAIKPGYRTLFYGPPGTGKTLTATLLGASVGVDVYRIDLSMVVSKYIGETEKNLANVFDQAENKNWILFFDEADALFGKRTQTSSSHDRYANQEISYLLQRIEDFPGVVILATNLKANIDDAFARRFQSIIYFPMPDAEQRLKLWQGILVNPNRLAEDVDLDKLATEYELSGGAITNAVRYGALRALRRADLKITQRDLVRGIAKEFFKEGKTA